MICHGPAKSRRLGGLVAPAKQSLINVLILPLRGHTYGSSFALHRGKCSESLSGRGRGGDRRTKYLEKKEKPLIPVEITQQQHRHHVITHVHTHQRGGQENGFRKTSLSYAPSPLP